MLHVAAFHRSFGTLTFATPWCLRMSSDCELCRRFLHLGAKVLILTVHKIHQISDLQLVTNLVLCDVSR